jgi:hypothetical protein
MLAGAVPVAAYPCSLIQRLPQDAAPCERDIKILAHNPPRRRHFRILRLHDGDRKTG